MKPSWNAAPPWANYLAQDKTGTWTWFENEPAILSGWRWDAPGTWQLANCDSDEWLQSNERRPSST